MSALSPDQRLVRALRRLVEAIATAQEVGCIKHLDCWDDAEKDWYRPIEQAEALLREFPK